jgi:hypothetical protein
MAAAGAAGGRVNRLVHQNETGGAREGNAPRKENGSDGKETVRWKLELGHNR